jgi:uncharacterized damage-inducible protein DinB
MQVRDLEQLFDYSYWANERIFRAAGQLTPEQFTQDIAGSYGSIRNTMVHALSAEWGWLDRSGGPKRGPKLKSEDYPTLQSLLDKWKTVEPQMREFLAGLKDADLARVVEFSITGTDHNALRVDQMLQHAMVHGAHHRGQLSLLLRTIGIAPGNNDMLEYFLDESTR